jgi:hypothetical protein
MSNIYYSLESSDPVLAVYCNKCNKCCSFCNSYRHDSVAFWTKEKKAILCPACAKLNPDQVYRKVSNKNDIPLNRSYFKTTSNIDREMFSDNNKNKKDHSYYFCTEKQEQNELSGKFQ